MPAGFVHCARYYPAPFLRSSAAVRIFRIFRLPDSNGDISAAAVPLLIIPALYAGFIFFYFRSISLTALMFILCRSGSYGEYYDDYSALHGINFFSVHT